MLLVHCTMLCIALEVHECFCHVCRAHARPCLSTGRTVISCWWDTGGDGYLRFMAKHRVGIEPLFYLDFWDRGRACARGEGRRG